MNKVAKRHVGRAAISRTGRARRRRAGWTSAARYAAMFAVLVLIIGPLAWQVGTSLKSPSEDVFSFPPALLPDKPTLQNYVQAFTDVPIGRYLVNSAIIAGFGVVTNVVLATTAGYALARLRFRGRNLYFAALVATVVVPFEVIMISTLLVTRSLGLTDTFAGVVLPHAVSVISIFVMRQAFLSLPRIIDDAAFIDGAGEWQVFRHVALPNVRGSIAAISIFSFIDNWDQFLWPLIVLGSPEKYPISVGLQFLSGTFSADERVVAAGTTLALLPPLLLFLILQRYFFRGLAMGGIKG